MLDAFYISGKYSEVIIKDNSRHYGTMELKQNDRLIHIFTEEMDDIIDDMISIRNEIYYTRKPRPRLKDE